MMALIAGDHDLPSLSSAFACPIVRAELFINSLSQS